MQVNPGEAFTIRREDGQFQCITGKKTFYPFGVILDLNACCHKRHDVLIMKFIWTCVHSFSNVCLC